MVTGGRIPAQYVNLVLVIVRSPIFFRCENFYELTGPKSNNKETCLKMTKNWVIVEKRVTTENIKFWCNISLLRVSAAVKLLLGIFSQKLQKSLKQYHNLAKSLLWVAWSKNSNFYPKNQVQSFGEASVVS